MIDTPMTELDAVNQMLLTIGEQKVNSLESSGVLEVEVARSTLQDVSRDVQAAGWHFNTEHRVRLAPDRDGCIILPRNCLRAWTPRRIPDVVQRGSRMYDLIKHTYAFKRPLHLSMTLFLDFDMLIPPAKRYITIRASRRFQERVAGSTVTEEFVMREEHDAKAELEAADAADADYNILHDNWPTLGTVARDRL